MEGWTIVVVNGVRIVRRILFGASEASLRVLADVAELGTAFEASYAASKSRR